MNRGTRELAAAPGSQGEKARRLVVSKAYASMIMRGERVPADELKAKIREAYGVDPRAWSEPDAAPAGAEPQHLVKVQRKPVEAAPAMTPVAAPAPSQPERAATVAPPPPPDDEQSLLERAREVRRKLEEKGLPQTEIARLKAVQAALTFEARLLGQDKVKGGLETHPDFGRWTDCLVLALQGVPGALEALEAWLTAATEQSRKDGT